MFRSDDRTRVAAAALLVLAPPTGVGRGEAPLPSMALSQQALARGLTRETRMYQHLLVPVDATELSIDLVGQAVALARSLGARLSFFHALPDPATQLSDDLEILRAVAPQAHALAVGGPVLELLAKSAATARALGVPCSTHHAIGDAPAGAIIKAARELGCDLIVMASHGSRTRLGMALGSQTLEVLRHAGLAVLVVAMGQLPAPSRALAVIRDEHRALAAVLHAWLERLQVAVHSGGGPEQAAMRAALHFLTDFSQLRHHPRESDHLFRLIRARTAILNAELDELDRQHERDRELLHVLTADLNRLEALGHADRPAWLTLQQDLQHFTEFVWEHLGREEGVVLPAAQRHLREPDWDELDRIFEADHARRTHDWAKAVLSELNKSGGTKPR